MKTLSPEVNQVLESECAHSVESVLSTKSPEHFQQLLEVLGEEAIGDNAKAKVLYTLGRWGDEAAVPVITQALPMLEEISRISAVDALSRLDSAKAVEAIASLAEDTSPYVRKFVAQSLVGSKKAQATKVLKAMQAKEKVEFVRNVLSR